MDKILTLLAVTLVNFLLAFAPAADEIRPLEKPQVKLATGEDYFPYVDKESLHGGWSQALVEAVFQHMGYELDVSVVPWSRALLWTKQHKVLGSYPYVYTSERAALYLYSVPINFIPVRLYVAKRSGITSVQQLSNKRFCLPYGYTVNTSGSSLLGKLNVEIIRAKDAMGCIGQVAKGWSDVGVTNSHIDFSTHKHLGQNSQSLVILAEELESVPLHFLISKTYLQAERWMQRFNQAYETISENGKKAAIDAEFMHTSNRPD